MKRLDIQVAEMRTISNVIKKLEGTREAALSLYKKPEKYNQRTSGNGRLSYCLIISDWEGCFLVISFLYFFGSFIASYAFM